MTHKVRLTRFYIQTNRTNAKEVSPAANKHNTMKRIITSLIGLCSLTATYSQANDVQKDMLDTFVKYAKIDSQSHDDSVCTEGQHKMALTLLQDIESAISAHKAKGVDCHISEHNYVYVTIPSNIKKECPSLGISCHLDVTPEAKGGNINPIIDIKDGRTIVRTDGTTLLGADDKCGCTIAMQLIRTLLSDKKLKHGKVYFVFCPNEDVGRAAENIDVASFNPDIIFDIDGTGGEEVTKSNFTARGFNVKFIGREAHPVRAKADKFGDATAAAATFIAFFPIEIRPENTEGQQGYIHPWSFEKKDKDKDVTVQTRVRYFDKAEGEHFDQLLKQAIDKVKTDYPNVGVEILFDGLQYENVAYTLHPQAMQLVKDAAAKTGKKIKFIDERAGTTASMFAAKGLKGGMCLFSGQHEVHSTREYADLQEMEEAYNMMLEIIKEIPTLK